MLPTEAEFFVMTTRRHRTVAKFQGSNPRTAKRSGSTWLRRRQLAMLLGLVVSSGSPVAAQAINVDSGQTATMSGQVMGNFTKTGGGTLILQPPSPFTDQVTIAAGTLQSDTNSLQGNIVNHSQLTFDQTGVNAASISSGLISGGGAVTIQGNSRTRMLTLSNANTFSGGLTLGGGAFVGVTNNSSLGTGVVRPGDLSGIIKPAAGAITLDNAITFDNDGLIERLQIIDADALTLAGIVSGGGELYLGGGSVTLTGTNTHANTQMSNGVFAIQSDASLGSSLGAVSIADSTLEFLASTESTRVYELSGDVIFRAAANSVVTLDGEIESDAASSLTLDRTGTIVLNNTTNLSDGVNVNAGTLKVNATVNGDVNVALGGTIGGTGFINGDLVNSGTVAAGNSIGTLNIAGDYTSEALSVTEVEIDDAGHSDRIVVAGDATINGGTVNVKSAPGNYVNGTSYTFLVAQSRTGMFDAITDDLAFFDARLGYTSTSAFFTLVSNNTSFASIAGNGNQVAVGNYIDSLTDNGAMSGLIDQFTLLTNSQVQSGLQGLSSELFGSSSQSSIQGTTAMLGSISNQIRGQLFTGPGPSSVVGLTSTGDSTRPSDSPIQLASHQSSSNDDWGGTTCDAIMSDCRPINRWRGWVMGYGLGGDADSDGNALGIDVGLGGTSFGVHRRVDANTQFGFFGGYVGGSVTTRGANQTLRSDSGNFGSFFTLQDDMHYVMGIGGLQFDGFDSSRVIAIGGTSQTTIADSDGWQGFTYGETGVNIEVNDAVKFQPFAGLQYVHARQNAFTETGAGAANLAVDGIDTDSLRSNLGGRLLHVTDAIGGWSITPEIRGSWLHEFLDTTSVVNAQFAGIGGAGFTANGLDLGRDFAVLGCGIGGRLSDHWELRADYNSQFNDRIALHIGSGSIAYIW